VAQEYRSSDWSTYVMDWRGDPHPVMEPPDDEIAEIDRALAALVDSGVLPHARYDRERFAAHRRAVRERFEIPWTGISPRMQRLLYAVNAIVRPPTLVAMGVFCGNTFISNAGAAIGPGSVYQAKRLVGIEIDPKEADRARRNVATIDDEGEAEIIGMDGVAWLEEFDGTIDLLYIDADGAYRRIIEQASTRALRAGSLVLAHNSVNQESELAEYLAFVRNPRNSVESVNMIVDDQGLEVTLWRGTR
jgi:predicted O-methyltransferase YrrM